MNFTQRYAVALSAVGFLSGVVIGSAHGGITTGLLYGTVVAVGAVSIVGLSAWVVGA